MTAAAYQYDLQGPPNKLGKPSLEVALTTLPLVLLMCSFKFRSAFPHIAVSGFPFSLFHFPPNKGRFPPVTLNFDL